MKAAFDAVKLLDHFMNDEEIALPLISRFIERTKAQLEAVPGLETAGDWESARRYAHMIKGSGPSMGGEDLGEAAARLELAYKNTDKDEMEAALPALQKAFECYKTEAEDFIRVKKSAGNARG